MDYADEDYYRNSYLLERKPAISADFAFYARTASRVIDGYTFNRLKDHADVPEVARMCCCELAEAEYRREKLQRDSGGKTAERVGTYSVSFVAAQDSAAASGREQRDIIMKWLGDTGLCYRGVE